MKQIKWMVPIFLLMVSTLAITQLAIAANNNRIKTELLPVYTATTQILSIPMLGIPAGENGYAYQVDMKLFSTDPIGLVVSNLSLLGNIAANEEISAIYKAESKTILLPTITFIAEDGSQIQWENIQLSLAGDPFIWFYVPSNN